MELEVLLLNLLLPHLMLHRLTGTVSKAGVGATCVCTEVELVLYHIAARLLPHLHAHTVLLYLVGDIDKV